MLRELWRQLLICAAGIYIGWTAHDLYSAKLELAITTAAHAAGESSRLAGEKVASESGRKLEEKLEALRNAQPVEIRTEVVKPVFTNVCVSADFVSLYNDAAAKAERALSGKSVNQMPGKTPAH